jgi:hypothetical protein
VWLERWLAILIIAKASEQLVDGISKTLVLNILIKLISEEFDFVDDAVGMVAIAITKKEVSAVIELIPLISGTIFHDVALLLKAFPDIGINLLEPGLQLGVFIGITINVVNGVEEIIGRSAIGESLDECLEISQRWLICFDKA